MPKTVKCGFDGDVPQPREVLIAYGPTLVVDIGFDPAYVSSLARAPQLGAKGVPALIDTGASECFIDSSLAAELILPVVDKQHVSGTVGRHEVNMHLAHIYVPSIGVCVNGRFGGVNLVAGGQRHSALIGRTFLMHFKFMYDGLTGAAQLIVP